MTITDAFLMGDMKAVEKINAKYPDKTVGDTLILMSDNEQVNYVLNRLRNMKIRNEGDLIFNQICTCAVRKMDGTYDPN